MDKGFCATIGFFDGVHRGHRFLIDRLRAEARWLKMGSMVVTFGQHPRQVLQQDYAPKLLTLAEKKRALLEMTGVDRVEVLDFTRELAALSAREFMLMLKERFGVKALLIGYDNRFGRNREESFEDYARHGKEIGLKVVASKELPVEGRSMSSSFVRQMLASGDIRQANRALDYRFGFQGLVVRGKGEGRKLGFPTANMLIDAQQLIPRRGVYAVEVWVEGFDALFLGMMNIGTQPTFGEFKETVEVNIFDFDADIYGRQISVEIIDRLREECRFSSIGELKAQLAADKDRIINMVKAY